MKPILNINQLKSDHDDQLVYRITFTQGADQITTEEDLLNHLKNSVPAKKGIINVNQATPDTWIITAHK